MFMASRNRRVARRRWLPAPGETQIANNPVLPQNAVPRNTPHTQRKNSAPNADQRALSSDRPIQPRKHSRLPADLERMSI
jgi:hypothetical protein